MTSDTTPDPEPPELTLDESKQPPRQRLTDFMAVPWRGLDGIIGLAVLVPFPLLPVEWTRCGAG
jgi:hypothetical protein